MKKFRFASLVTLAALALSSMAYAQMGGRDRPSSSHSFRGYDGRELEHNLVLPQIALGERYTTTIVLLNLGDQDRMGWLSPDRLRTRGKISFYGPDGTRFAVSVNGAVPVSEFLFVIDPAKSVYLELSAPAPDTSAWALIEVEESERLGMMDDQEMYRGRRLMATAFYTLKEGGEMFSRVGVIPSLYEMGRYFTSIVAAQYRDDLSTGVAIVNTSTETALIELRLKDADGRTLARNSFHLRAGNQIARFVQELLGSGVPYGLNGSLEVVTTGEGVVTMGLLISKGILTSIPTFHYGRLSGMMP